MIRTATLCMLLPTALSASELSVESAVVPLAPPAAMVHAAYFTLTNNGQDPRRLIGVTAVGYTMAHVHRTEVKDDIATMFSVDLLEIVPGQSIAFQPGGLHVMLMRPENRIESGGTVELVLEFANGETVQVSAEVVPMTGNSVSDGS